MNSRISKYSISCNGITFKRKQQLLKYAFATVGLATPPSYMIPMVRAAFILFCIHDSARTRWILSRMLLDSSNSRNLPATSGIPLSSMEFIVKIGLGTPKEDFLVLFDTGSDVTWLQCEPCPSSCHPQEGPRFNPHVPGKAGPPFLRPYGHILRQRLLLLPSILQLNRKTTSQRFRKPCNTDWKS
ncbi:ASPARTIC PROTEASE IN GUARD CELL 1 protein [Nymphaea thermarum]|nr:ASPARTIC PROTEASE IN GUARD CELL 1 protein [Nymphaea thermarum]